MGYCIGMTDNKFCIKKENLVSAFKKLQEFMKEKENSRMSWVEPKIVVETDSFEEAFDEIRYPLIENKNGDYELDYFAGEKLGDDVEILNSFAEYVEAGSYIGFIGEDGAVFRFVFDGSKCEFKNGKVDWE